MSQRRTTPRCATAKPLQPEETQTKLTFSNSLELDAENQRIRQETYQVALLGGDRISFVRGSVGVSVSQSVTVERVLRQLQVERFLAEKRGDKVWDVGCRLSMAALVKLVEKG